MHEMPIAAEIVQQAAAVAEAHDATRVEAVEVTIGAMRLVVPEALQMAFAAMAQGTLIEGATLEIKEIAVEAVCNDCGERFAPDIDHSFMCPGCHKADVKIVAGDDIILASVVCETAKEAGS